MLNHAATTKIFKKNYCKKCEKYICLPEIPRSRLVVKPFRIAEEILESPVSSDPLGEGVVPEEAENGLVVRDRISHDCHKSGVVVHLLLDLVVIEPEVVAQHVVLGRDGVDQPLVEADRISGKFPVVLNWQTNKHGIALGVAENHVCDCSS